MPSSTYGPIAFRIYLKEDIMQNELKIKSVLLVRNESWRCKALSHLHFKVMKAGPWILPRGSLNWGRDKGKR